MFGRCGNARLLPGAEIHERLGWAGSQTGKHRHKTLGRATGEVWARRTLAFSAPVLPCCGRIVATGAARRARARGNAPRQVERGMLPLPYPRTAWRADAAPHARGAGPPEGAGVRHPGITLCTGGWEPRVRGRAAEGGGADGG